MNFIYVCAVLLPLVFQVLTQIGNNGPPMIDLSTNQKPCHKLNAVLFLAQFSTSCTSTNNNPSDALKYLQLEERTRVKHCISHNIHGNGNMLLMYKINRWNRECGCKEKFKSSLKTLINYCKNALNMHTSIVTESGNDAEAEAETPAEPPEQEPVQIPMQHVPCPDQKCYSTIIKRKTDIITAPQHSEFFKIIRSKRQAKEEPCDEKPKEIVNVPLDQQEIPKPLFAVVDVIAKFSFFGNILKNSSGQGNDNNNVGGANPPEQEIGKIKDQSLFDNVKKALCELQEQPEVPFLLVVFGGDLSDIYNKESPLIQSIKYVVENTDCKNTLVVLTSSCPPEKSEQHPQVEVNINEESAQNSIPIYAGGPGSELFKNCKQLDDIPLIIKTALSQTENPEESRNANMMAQSRNKRSLLGNVKPNNQMMQTSSKLTTVISYLLVSILFLL